MKLYSDKFLSNNCLLGNKYGSNTKIISIFISHMGCPNTCVFCNQRHISGNATLMTPQIAGDIIDSALSAVRDYAYECAFYGGSFTGLEYSLMEDYLRIPFERGLPIRLSTRPDYIDANILKLLKKYGVRVIELGVQSLSDTVLHMTKRNHTSIDTHNAVNMIRDAGFEFGIQTMIGLPGDTDEEAIRTASVICGIKPDFVRIYPTLVIKGTELDEMYNSGHYMPMSLNNALELSSILLDMYDAAGIRVIRLGLQASEEISIGAHSKIVAGPFHSAFRQLAETRLLAREIAAHNPSLIELGRDTAQFLYGHDKYGLHYLSQIADSMMNNREIECYIRSDLKPNCVSVYSDEYTEPITIML